MNLRELQYLVAIDDERHFNKAAQRCFVSQPTLSGQLKKLEDELGVLLVERNNRQVAMTEAGKAVAEQARKVLMASHDIREIAQSYKDPLAGDLHVGLIPTVAPYLLPVIMHDIKLQFPALKLWLHEYQTAFLLEKLRKGELDVLILALMDTPGDFSDQLLYREPFQLAVPVNHPLSKKKAVTLADLVEQEVLLLDDGHCMRGQALDICFRAGATENVSYHATSLETLRHMVGEGMGITLMPELAVPVRQAKQEGVRYVPFEDPKPNRRIGLLYRKGSYREQAFNQLNEVIRLALPVGVFF